MGISQLVLVTNPPVRISSVYASGYQVVNTSDSAMVYLGQDSSVSPTNYGVPLSPGASLQWNGNTELWGVTDSGTTATLSVLFDSNALFSPGPASVFSKSSALPELIESDTFTIPSSAGSYSFSPLNNVDISKYSSLYVQVEASTQSSLVPNVSDYLNLILVQYDSGNPTSTYAMHPTWLLCMADIQDITLPVRQNTLYYQLDVYRNAGIALTLTVRVFGSYSVVSECSYSSTPFYFIPPSITNGIPWGGIAYTELSVIGFSQAWIASVNGPYALWAWKSGSGNLAKASVYVALDGVLVSLADLWLEVGLPRNGIEHLNIPMAPVFLELEQRTVAGLAKMSLTPQKYS